MSYRYTQFGSVTLPTAQAGGDTSTGSSELGLLLLPDGGVGDTYGTGVAPVRYPYESRWSCIATATTAASLRTVIDALRGLRGDRAYLYRKGSDSDTAQWAYARLNQVQSVLDPAWAQRHRQRLDFNFTILGPWHGAQRNTTVILSASSEAVSASNNGNRTVQDAVITVTAGSAQMTSLTLDATGINWTYTGSVAAAKAVVIDCGAWTVKDDGTDDYANFATSASHTSDNWLPLIEGVTALTVTRTGGAAGSILIDYYEAWE